ncbi:MAG: restriction endonuclease subunit S [Desulfamplus sp.]
MRLPWGYAFKSSKFLSDGKYQIIKMSNVYGSNLDLKRSRSFLNKIDSIEEHYILKTNEILITLTGTVGKKDFGYTYLIKDEPNLLLNQRVGRIIINELVNPAYAFYQIKMPVFSNQFFELSKGGTGNQTNVGTKDIDNILIPLPPTLAEQTAIANALSDADALITSLEKLIEKKRNIKQGAMQKLLQPKEGWEVKRLGEIAEVATGTTPPTKNLDNYGEEYCFVSPADLGRVKYILNTEKKLSKKGFGISRRFPKYSILFTCIGSTIGKSGITNFEMTSNQQINAVFPNDSYSTEFLYYSLNLISEQIKLSASEQALPMINKTEFEKILIQLPTKEEQTHIASILSDMDNEITALENKLEKYKKIKLGMMQNLLTGKIRLL